MNFLSGDGTGMTVEGFSPNVLEAIQNDTNSETRMIEFFLFMIFKGSASERDPPSVTVLLVFGVDAVQLQVGGLFGQLHVNPAVGMAFAEIVADCRLADEMEMVPSVILPLVSVTVEIGPGMLAFAKQIQERRPVTHALDGAHAAIGGRVEVAKDQGWLVHSFVKLLGPPVQLFFSQDSLSS